MESAEKHIPRHIHRPVIAFEIAVMKLMVKVPDHHPAALAKQQFVEAGMAENR